MGHIGTTPNKIMATFWIVLAVFVAFGSIPVLWSPAKLLILSFLLFSVILFLMGLQRTEKHRFDDDRFDKLIATLGISTAILSALALPLNVVLF